MRVVFFMKFNWLRGLPSYSHFLRQLAIIMSIMALAFLLGIYSTKQFLRPNDMSQGPTTSPPSILRSPDVAGLTDVSVSPSPAINPKHKNILASPAVTATPNNINNGGSSSNNSNTNTPSSQTNASPTPSLSTTPTPAPQLSPTPTPDAIPLEATWTTSFSFENGQNVIKGIVTANQPLAKCDYDATFGGMSISGNGTIDGNTCTAGGSSNAGGGCKNKLWMRVELESGESKEFSEGGC